MEVQDRPVFSSARLIEALAGSHDRLLARLGCALVVVAALVVVVAQPLGSPWWTYADADATYTASSLNLMLGTQVKYLDHPGLPLEELGAVVFGADYLVQRSTGKTSSRAEYVDETMLNLDRARPFFRTIASLFYLLGATLSFVLMARLFGHWAWGVAGGLLWLAAPGLLPMSIQFRPDVPLAVLAALFAYLVARALDTRALRHYVGAALALGLAVMTKMHAAGMAPALVLAVLWRPPDVDWTRLRANLPRLGAGRKRIFLGAALLVWGVAAVLLNAGRVPFSPTRGQLVLLLGPPVAVAIFLAASFAAARAGAGPAVRRVLHPGYGVVAAALLAGLYAPLTLDLPDGLRSLVNVADGLRGRGINEGIQRFNEPLSHVYTTYRTPFLIFCVAGVAALVGLVKRDPRPVVWFAAAVPLGIMAEARLAAPHYFAPAFVLSVPAALWLFRQVPARAGLVVALPLALYAAWPALRDREAPAAEADRFAAVVASSEARVQRELRPGEIAFVPSYWPFADSRYFELVQIYVNHTPDYPYRFLPATYDAADYASERGARFRYYLGPEVASLAGTQTSDIGDIGEFKLRRVPGTDIAAELLAGPGVSTPWSHPDATYDPHTGYFKDAAGRYWDRKGTPIANPPKRRRVDGLWVDAYGDFWNESGRLVKSDPSLRTVP